MSLYESIILRAVNKRVTINKPYFRVFFFPFFFFFFFFSSNLKMSEEGRVAVVGIVGGGLVGALNAIYFAQRGWDVKLFELRPGTV